MGKLLLGTDAFAFLAGEGIAVLKTIAARDEDEAVTAAREAGFPVTLKISSPDVLHKTETGGIRTDLRDADEVRKAFREIVAGFAAGHPGKRKDGVMVQRQGRGVELIIGCLRDQQFGPVLMCGLGGIFVEATRDVSFRMIPLDPPAAKTMLEDLKGYGVLTSTRRERIDLAAVEGFLLQISRLVERHPGLVEMDLNPVFVSAAGAVVCDARIKMETAG